MVTIKPIQSKNCFGHLPDIIAEMEELGLIISENASLLSIGEWEPSACIVNAYHGKFINYNSLLKKGLHHYSIPFKKNEIIPKPYDKKFNISILEGYMPYCFRITKMFPDWKIYHCNILEAEAITNINWSEFDFIIWSHGPEHVSKDNAIRVVNYLQKHSKFIVLIMPNGYYRQGIIEGNYLEQHQHHWKAEDWLDLDCDATVIPYGKHNTQFKDTGSQLKVLIPGKIK